MGCIRKQGTTLLPLPNLVEEWTVKSKDSNLELVLLSFSQFLFGLNALSVSFSCALASIIRRERVLKP
jgi:hypothetical protein